MKTKRNRKNLFEILNSWDNWCSVQRGSNVDCNAHNQSTNDHKNEYHKTHVGNKIIFSVKCFTCNKNLIKPC